MSVLTQTVDAAYIHIPFCKKICHYCAFNKYFYDGQPVDRYLIGLNNEMRLYEINKSQPLDTIYVGGGTPSCLNMEELDILLNSIHQHLPLDEKTEFTFEINPGELSLEKCALLYDAGVNRISMGVQTFNDSLLRKIGRNHRQQHIYQSIEWLRQVGFTNISIDLIFRLPGQTIEDFDESLDKALDLDLPHYSLYSLIIENQTVFQQLMREGKLPLPSEDVDADMFELAIKRLEENAIHQYEVSNFAKEGYQSRHNIKYWQYKPYYGFGAGAHGFVDETRYYNHGPVHHYLNKTEQDEKPIINTTPLSQNEQMEEYLFLALRTNQGFRLSAFQVKFKVSALDLFGDFFDLQNQRGLLMIDADRVFLTQRGLFLADTVFRDLIGWLSNKGGNE
ncbi:radical SAM family heme chaperone HemW [Fundicoccus culcitae]|uniref:Heme chaperone HemW n=1 Tax=Fundicoccus culcitae TaxID=2969821 RepID=A0ABY5P8A9_9LACT|nr:radical SAM family heme chaperone HemW [Fundicoccus culcitae]UUX34620.1 radical SAM family heme chaperone HemW [Fundicoccus culcitae]